jgi:transmembrane sensor
MKHSTYWQQLFTRYARGRATPAQRQLLDSFYQQQTEGFAEEVWAELDETPDQVRQRLKARIDQGRQPAAPSAFPWLRVAASVTLVLALAGALLFAGHSRRHLPQLAQAQTVTAPAGQRRTLTLPDGTHISLNSGSTLRWYPAAYSRKQRRVYLQGEAFFSVHRDTLRPFEVVTAKLTTRVLGTRFNVRTHDGRYAVAVASGKVRVVPTQNLSRSVLLTAWMQTSLSPGTSQLLTTAATPDAYAWTTQTLVFHQLPLAQVVRQLKRWYGVPIHYDARLADEHITARYQGQPLDHVLRSLAFSLRCSYRQEPGRGASLQLPSLPTSQPPML